MPIVVGHDASPAAIGAAAFLSGQGQYQQRAQELSLQAAMQLIAMRQRQQEEANRLALAQQAQALQAEQALRDDQLRYLGMDAQFGMANQRNQLELLGLQQQAAYRQAALQQQRNEAQQQMARQAAHQQYQYDVGGVDELEQEVTRRQQFSTQKLTPEGQRLYGDMSGKLRAIRQQRASLRPQQYQQLLSQWVGEFDQAGLPNHVMKVPDIKEVMQTRYQDLPDGRTLIMQPDGRLDLKDNKKTQAEGEQALPNPAKYYSTPANYEKSYKTAAEALDRLREEQLAERNRVIAENAKAAASAEGNRTQRKVPEMPTEPTEAEIHAEMLRRYIGQQGFLRQFGAPHTMPGYQPGATDTVSVGQPAAAPQTAQAATPQSQATDEESYDLAIRQLEAQMARYAGRKLSPDEQAVYDTLSGNVERLMRGRAAAAQAAQLSPASQPSNASPQQGPSRLPAPQSKAELDSLMAGLQPGEELVYIGPDGRVWRKVKQ